MNSGAIAVATLAVMAGAVLLVHVLGATGASGGHLLAPADARALIAERQESEDFFVFDVRTPPEFASGHIEGAVNMPSGEVTEWMEPLPRDATYLIYCATGVRSARVRSLMEEVGFGRVYEIEGGYAAWQAASP